MKSQLYVLLDKALTSLNWEEVAYLRERIKGILKQETMGFMVRSRQGENAEEEQASLFHAARELKTGGRSDVSTIKVKDNQGNLVDLSDPGQIELEITKFFETLFNGQHRTVPGSPDPVDTGILFEPNLQDLPEFMQGLGNLSPEDRVALDAPLTL